MIRTVIGIAINVPLAVPIWLFYVLPFEVAAREAAKQ